jgi:hypothetical protein
MKNTYSNLEKIKLGTSVDLVKGLNSNWNPTAGQTSILFPSNQKAMEPSEVSPTDERGEWSFPEITLCDNALEMLDALVSYKVVNPSSEVDAPSIGSGALLMGCYDNSKDLNALSKSIGIDLSNSSYGYAVVKLTRYDDLETHASNKNGILIHARPRKPDPKYKLTQDFISSATNIRHSGRSRKQDYNDELNVNSVSQVIDLFANYGTHYVSAVELGDSIYQVYAYALDKYQAIKEAYASYPEGLNGLLALDFSQFTTNSQDGEFGFVAEYGQILCLSNSSAFTDSMKSGKWMDTVWAKQNSVFTLFNNGSPITIFDLNANFLDQTISAVELASLSVMIEHKRSLVWQRVFKACMVQKYRSNIEANFEIYDDRDFAKLLPQDQNGVVSYLSTPNINVYKTRLDISDMQFVASDTVKSFILFTNVLEDKSNGTVSIPGTDVQLYAQIFDMRTSGQAKKIKVADDAFDSLDLGCDEFLGALSIISDSEEYFNVIVDGFKFGLEGSGKEATPTVLFDVRIAPPADAIPSLINSIQFSMAFAEAVISDQSAGCNQNIQRLVRSYLTWLASIIPGDSQDEEIIAIRVKAMDLAHYANDPNYGSFVPILPYSDYEHYVDSILKYLDRIQTEIRQNDLKMDNRKTQELVINVGQVLNENIVASGDMVSGIIDANVSMQNDLEGYYDSLITQKQAEANQEQSKLNDLNAALFEAQGEIDLASQKYKSAVERWQTMEAIKFGLDVATNLFSLGTTIAVPATSITAVKDLGKTVQKIQKTLNVLNASWKLYSGIEKGINAFEGAQSALDGLDGDTFGITSDLTWDEMSINYKKTMSTGPDLTEKTDLNAAFDILILRGKAVSNAQSTLHNIQRDIYTNQQQKEINKRQADRLSKLQNNLKPDNIQDLDVDKIDLMSLTGHLSFVQNQLLSILSKAFVQQDLALQYANLQPTTVVTSFSLLKFSSAIVEQNNKTIEAKSLLAHYQSSTTNVIEYKIEGVHPSQLTKGNFLSKAICLDAKEFYQYVDARVKSVVLTIDGVNATDGGKYLTQLSFNGTPFQDRNIERDRLNFRTPWRERVYEFEVKDNKPHFSDGGNSWSDGVSPVTPFGTWEIGFPDTQTNKGISFDSNSLTVTLSFVLQARLVDAMKMSIIRAVLAERRSSKLSSLVSRNAMTLMSARSLPSPTDLIGTMYNQGTCTNGWDVVFSMGLNQINASLRDQYKELKENPDYSNQIKVDTSEDYPGGVTVITKFEINYGYPLMSFQSNNSSTKLEMEILSGSMQKCSKVGDNPEVCDKPIDLKGEKMTAIIDLSKVEGQTKVGGSNHNTFRVELNMKEGIFDVAKIDLSDIEQVEFNKEVKAYFANNPVIFLINELDLTNVPTLDALKPSNFIFSQYESPEGMKMLQLFIMTGERALLPTSQAHLNNIPEPLPQGSDSSMIVRSKLVFQDVLPQSLTNNNWELSSIDPGSPSKAWSSKLEQGYINADVDLTPLNHTSSSSSQGAGSSTSYSYSIPGGNPASWSLEGTKIVPQNSGQMKYSGSKEQDFKYNQESCSTYWPCFFNCSPKCSTSELSSDFSLDVTAALPLGVDGTGRDQKIKISTSGKGVKVSGHLSGGGPSGSDDLEAQVNQQIQKQIPAQIAENLKFDFETISVFALKNLLFPTNNYIVFATCAIPGDLLLLGNFKKD